MEIFKTLHTWMLIAVVKKLILTPSEQVNVINLNYRTLLVTTIIMSKYLLGTYWVLDSSIVNMRNSLSNYVVEANSVNTFKNGLTIYWPAFIFSM